MPFKPEKLSSLTPCFTSPPGNKQQGGLCPTQCPLKAIIGVCSTAYSQHTGMQHYMGARKQHTAHTHFLASPIPAKLPRSSLEPYPGGKWHIHRTQGGGEARTQQPWGGKGAHTQNPGGGGAVCSPTGWHPPHNTSRYNGTSNATFGLACCTCRRPPSLS